MKKVLLLLALCASMGAHAQTSETESDTLYQSKDKRGRTTYLSFKNDLQLRRKLADESILLSKALNLKSGTEELRLIKTSVDNLGFTNKKYQHYYKGVLVEGAQYTSHSRVSVESINGYLPTFGDIPTTPNVSESNALQTAINSVKAITFIWQDTSVTNHESANADGSAFYPKGELLITDAVINDRDSSVLAWRYQIITTKPRQNLTVYINALTGALIKQINGSICVNTPGTAETMYNGTRNIVGDSYAGGFRLFETRGTNGTIWTINYNHTGTVITEFADADNNWLLSQHPNDQAAHDIHNNAELTIDLLSTLFGRSGINGSGSQVRSYVHFRTNFENAQWDKSSLSFYYGDGDNLGPFASLDIVAHEIAHALDYFEANITSGKETGAVKECLGDILAAITEANQAPGKLRWIIGEDITGFGVGLRSLDNPNSSLSPMPDTYNGTFYVPTAGCTPSTSNDECGVHTNCSIGGHWFYRTVVGGSGINDNNDAFNITGIPINEAALIVYRALTVYMVSNTDYAAMRNNTIQAAVDLYGAGSCQVRAVTNAWYAVGVGAAYVSTMAISSPTAICTSSTVTFNQLPAGTSASWSISPAGVVTLSASTGTSITVTRVGSVVADATLSATATLSCGTVLNFTKVIHTGIPTTLGSLFKKENVGNNCGWDIYIYLPTGADDVYKNTSGSTWVVCPKTWNASVQKYECKVDVNLEGPATATYTLRATGPCGNTANSSKSITVQKRSVNCMARMAQDTTVDNANLTDTAFSTAKIAKDLSAPKGELSIKTYPNPANQILTVESQSGKIQSIRLTTLSGQIIKTYSFGQSLQRKVQIDVSGQPNGLYLISVFDGQTQKSKKINILH